MWWWSINVLEASRKTKRVGALEVRKMSQFSKGSVFPKKLFADMVLFHTATKTVCIGYPPPRSMFQHYVEKSIHATTKEAGSATARGNVIAVLVAGVLHCWNIEACTRLSLRQVCPLICDLPDGQIRLVFSEVASLAQLAAQFSYRAAMAATNSAHAAGGEIVCQ